jgi:hypothetical protein
MVMSGGDSRISDTLLAKIGPGEFLEAALER